VVVSVAHLHRKPFYWIERWEKSPLYGTDLDLERSKDVSREVPL
jgi:hypothetical protein